MKILHIAAGNLFGGVESVLVTLAEQPQGRIEHHFALCFPGRLSEELRKATHRVHSLGSVRLRYPWRVRAVRKRLASLLERQQFDAVVCHSSWLMVVFAPVVRASRQRLLFWVHDLLSTRSWLDRWSQLVRPDLIIANSEFTAKAATLLFPGTPVQIFYYPVASSLSRLSGDAAAVRARVRASLGAPEDAVVIIAACRLERWKGQTLLIAALARLRAHPGWQCWIAGGVQRPHEQKLLDDLKEQVKAAKISDRVHFLGQRSDVPDLLCAADIHCQPNTGPEPFGIVFVEALSVGLPVVSTQMGGGAVEIIEPSCGFLVPADPESVAGALRRLIDNREERVRMGERGMTRARELCDPTTQVGRFERLLGAEENNAKSEVVRSTRSGERCMKVLHIAAGNLFGGVESVLVTLASQPQGSIEHHFALCFPGRLLQELEKATDRVHSLGPVRLRYPWRVRAVRQGLASLLERQQFDAVICHSSWLMVMFAKVVRASGPRLLFWVRDPLSMRSWLDRWSQFVRPDLIVANSQFTAKAAKLLFRDTSVEVVYNPVVLSPARVSGDRSSVRARVRANLGAPKDAIVIIAACRLERWKGQDLLIQALSRLRAHPGWHCWIAGGVQRPHEQKFLRELEDLVKAESMSDRIQFLGQRSDVPDLLCASDIYCQPNTGPEPFGNSFVEALAAGLPVITTQMGGAVEIIEPSCGLLVQADPDSVAGALSRLVDDREERMRMGQNGVTRARALCDPATQVGRLEALVRAAI